MLPGTTGEWGQRITCCMERTPRANTSPSPPPTQRRWPPVQIFLKIIASVFYPAVDPGHLHWELEGHAWSRRHLLLRQASLHVCAKLKKSRMFAPSCLHSLIFIPRRLYGDGLIRFFHSILCICKSFDINQIFFPDQLWRGLPHEVLQVPLWQAGPKLSVAILSNLMVMLVQVCHVKMTSFSQSAKVPSRKLTGEMFLLPRRSGLSGWTSLSPTLGTPTANSPSLTTPSASSRLSMIFSKWAQQIS